MKICIAQQNYQIGNFEQNTQQMLSAIEAAKEQGADLILFSEMSVCGYPARDFVEFNDFIKQTIKSELIFCYFDSLTLQNYYLMKTKKKLING